MVSLAPLCCIIKPIEHMKASEAIYTQEAYPAYDYCVTKQSNTARYNSAEIYSTNAQHVFWLGLKYGGLSGFLCV
jgi:hypothetical protein